MHVSIRPLPGLTLLFDKQYACVQSTLEQLAVWGANPASVHGGLIPGPARVSKPRIFKSHSLPSGSAVLHLWI